MLTHLRARTTIVAEPTTPLPLRRCDDAERLENFDHAPKFIRSFLFWVDEQKNHKIINSNLRICGYAVENENSYEHDRNYEGATFALDQTLC